MLDWMENASKDLEDKQEVLSFQDYIEQFEKDIYCHTRPTFQYILDMLNHFGVKEDGSFKLFEENHIASPAVFGQKNVQQQIVQNLNNFREEGFNNKFILLVGPNGSSKSSLVRKLMKGLELYSDLPEGPLYTFNWIFPIDQYVKGSLGLGSKQVASDISSYAYLEDKDISAILPSELKDDPLLLIPIEHRRKILEEGLKDNQNYLDSIRKSYLYNGDLSKRNRMIYDALLKNYKGRHQDVLKHIRVERFHVSRRYSVGAVTIEPQLHVDAQMQQITMDKRLASLPPSLQSLNLFSLKGEVVLANRGILEFSDLLKRPMDAFKYLLMTMETNNINLQGILTELDTFFIGTSNEVHLAAFKQHPDYNSFKGRFSFIKVPYLLDYQEEERIYEEQVKGLSDIVTFEPHSISALCLFSVLTRLRCPQVKNYEDKKLANIVTNLNPLEKALFIATGHAPQKLDVESIQILEAGKSALLQEYENDALYEGKFGISPRDIKHVIYRLATKRDHLTFFDVIEYLQKLITKKNEYDFLNIPPQADYHHPARFLSLIKEHFLNITDREVRDSLGMVDNRSYSEYLKKYVENVIAMTKGEKVRNNITGRYEDVDQYSIEEFEKNINLKEDVKAFRSQILTKLGAYSLDNPGRQIEYTDVFPSIVDRLKESFRSEQKKSLKVISRNIVFYEKEITSDQKENNSPLTEDHRALIHTVVTNLEKHYNYSRNGALNILKYLLKERY